MKAIPILKKEIWHPDFNLDKKTNLSEIPTKKAVFGIFAIVNEQPINCRWVQETENLQAAIKEVFETPVNPGLKNFMQGPWVKMLQYQLMPNSTEESRLHRCQDWNLTYNPDINEEGEYPGYYDH